MKKLLTALFVGVMATSAVAADKKAEPAKKEAKASAKKDAKKK